MIDYYTAYSLIYYLIIIVSIPIISIQHNMLHRIRYIGTYIIVAHTDTYTAHCSGIIYPVL